MSMKCEMKGNRYKLWQWLCAASAGLVLLSSAAGAATPPATLTSIPATVNYQATLKQASGSNYVDGVYTVELRLYAAASGGTPLWGASYNVYVKDGQFGVMLGASGGSAVTPAPTYGPTELWKAAWYDDTNPTQVSLYLGMKVTGAAAECVPRQQFLCAPFAFRAHQAQYAQYAQYARTSVTNFDVPGDLMVGNIDQHSISRCFTLSGGYCAGYLYSSFWTPTDNDAINLGYNYYYCSGVNIL